MQAPSAAGPGSRPGGRTTPSFGGAGGPFSSGGPFGSGGPLDSGGALGMCGSPASPVTSPFGAVSQAGSKVRSAPTALCYVLPACAWSFASMLVDQQVRVSACCLVCRSSGPGCVWASGEAWVRLGLSLLHTPQTAGMSLATRCTSAGPDAHSDWEPRPHDVRFLG